MTHTAGVDIGGSSVRAVARTESGEIVGRYETKMVVDGGSQLASAAVAALEALELTSCDAVGVGVPGQIDPKTRRLTMAVNLGVGMQPYNLAGEIESALGVPVVIENDVRAAALGFWELLRLEGKSPESLALVNIGTGISAGVVVKGLLLRGAHGMAGEIGHVVVDESGAVCRCGQRGCLEALAAGPAIGRAWPKGGADTSATALFSAVTDGDPAAEKVASRITGHLTTALIWMAAAYDTEVIVLAGGVTGTGDVFLNMVRDHISSRGTTSQLAARRLRPDQVTMAAGDEPPGALGAALLAMDHLLRMKNVHEGRKASNRI